MVLAGHFRGTSTLGSIETRARRLRGVALRVVAHLDIVRTSGKVLAERMTDKAVIGQDPAQIRDVRLNRIPNRSKASRSYQSAELPEVRGYGIGRTGRIVVRGINAAEAQDPLVQRRSDCSW